MSALPSRLPRPGAELAYSDPGGEGEAVVLLHGAGLDHTVFTPQSGDLRAAGYRVISTDLRGHGLSALSPGARVTAPDLVQDLLALLDACEIPSATLVGHSIGGNIAQALIRSHPQRVTALIGLDTSWNTGPLTRLEGLALRSAAPLLSLVPARSLPGLMARASAVTPAAITRARALFAAMPRREFVDVWRAAAAFIDPDPTYRCPVPVALVHGARDRTGNIAAAMPRWARAEGAAHHVIEGAGHLPTWDAPEETTRVLRAILDAWYSRGGVGHVSPRSPGDRPGPD